ncbi:MAG: TIR domain-containing protein [Sandaracinaceae bacterium]|nr:MAG: TIR domain-containing protein [Sandaracinaceae bacterium]
MTDKKRVFIAFAKEDERFRNLLKGQSLNEKTPFEFIDMSVKEAYESAWKTKVQTRIRGSHGVLVLLSKHTLNAEGQLWEIKCALDESKPIVGMFVDKNDLTVPRLLRDAGVKCIDWSWVYISAYFGAL